MTLDPTAAVDLRIDAITLFVASRQSGEGVLRVLLESGDMLIITETLKRIREFRTEWAVSEIIAKVKVVDEPSERAILAWALAGFSGNHDVVEVLMKLIKQDPDINVRNHAIESLSQFRSPRVVDALLSVLQRGSAIERFWALYSLGAIGDSRAVEAIGQCLQDQTFVQDFGTISSEAKWALGRIKGSA
jgi:hypothetical protein